MPSTLVGQVSRMPRNDALPPSRTADAGPLVPQHQVGRALGIRWSKARSVLERAGVAIIQESTRRWYVRRLDWDAFLAKHQLRVAQ